MGGLLCICAGSEAAQQLFAGQPRTEPPLHGACDVVYRDYVIQIPAVLKVEIEIKIKNTPRVRPKTTDSGGKRQYGPSLGTPGGRGGQDKIKKPL